MALDALVSQSPWALFGTVVVLSLTLIIIVMIALRGADPKDRPNIIKAVAELFRWWRRP